MGSSCAKCTAAGTAYFGRIARHLAMTSSADTSEPRRTTANTSMRSPANSRTSGGGSAVAAPIARAVWLTLTTDGRRVLADDLPDFLGSHPAFRAQARALDERRQTVSAGDVLAGTEAVLAEWNAGLPRRVQSQLARAEVRGAWPMLIAAARASGTPDGWFGLHDVAGESADADMVSIRRTLDGFTGEIDLFDREDGIDGREPRYRFRTQGLAQLLGLSAALARAGR